MQPEVDGLGVDHRQRAGQAEADRAGVRVRRVAEATARSAQNIFVRVDELDVDLQPDDGLVLDRAGHAASAADAAAVEAERAARARARRRGSRFSLNAGPASWKPVGRPSERPLGIEIAGIPASDIGTVQ